MPVALGTVAGIAVAVGAAGALLLRGLPLNGFLWAPAGLDDGSALLRFQSGDDDGFQTLAGQTLDAVKMTAVGGGSERYRDAGGPARPVRPMRCT